MRRCTVKSAIQHINKYGALLVFPIKTNLQVPSLWNCFHPRTTMRWEWTSDSGDLVPELWHLREELSRCRKVVYAKWYQGRATLFSLDVFTALLSSYQPRGSLFEGLNESSQRVYRTLLDDSPLPTKSLRELSGLSGRENEAEFHRAMRALWRHLLIVGYGEIEEGGFPSLAVGCSKLLFEDLWDRATLLSEHDRETILRENLPPDSPFLKLHKRIAQSHTETSN